MGLSGVLNFCFRISGCCYGYCDLLCDWWIWLSALSMIGCFNYPMTGVRLQPSVQLQPHNAPIKFKEIVTVMIMRRTTKTEKIITAR